jgi:thiamine-phosphate pyrophosphorylase
MIAVVTNRSLCVGNFLEHIARIASAKPSLIILREKDMPGPDYLKLAKDCRDICAKYDTPLAVNTHIHAAETLGIQAIHLPMRDFMENRGAPGRFKSVGVSIHSVSEAELAEKWGAAYVIAGHIFETASKKGVPPRGLPFLQDVCRAVRIPVLAIGGISDKNAAAVTKARAAGFCMMSELMRHPSPEDVISCLRRLALPVFSGFPPPKQPGQHKGPLEQEVKRDP